MKPLGFTLAEMKDLLHALDILDDDRADPAQRATARAGLLAFRDKTADSADRLRRHLTYAEEFADLLAGRAGQ